MSERVGGGVSEWSERVSGVGGWVGGWVGGGGSGWGGREGVGGWVSGVRE